MVPHVLGERLGTSESVLGLGISVPKISLGRTAEGITVRLFAGVKAEGRKIVLQEILRLVVADNHDHVGVPLVEFVVHDLEGLHDFLMVVPVLTQSVVLTKLFQ